MSRTTRGGKERTVEEAVSYAVGHRIRVEVLSALNERSYSASELSRVVHQPLSTVTHHVDELLNSNAIEIATTKQVGNVTQTFYRAIEVSFYTEEEMADLDPEARQAIYGVILQNATAEAMASLWAGKISEDPRAHLTWAWFNLDDEGRRLLADEMEQWWGRLYEIQADAAARLAKSEAAGQSMIVTMFGYERSRTPVDPGNCQP